MITVVHTIDRLAADLAKIPAKVARELPPVVRRAADDGNDAAKAFAKESAGSHGKHYHKAFSVERLGPLEYEYGPDASKPQGGMSFEGGSRNQPPHNDLAKSADTLAEDLSGRVNQAMDGWFW